METASGDTKECPFCAETIKKAAKICRFCGSDLATGIPSSQRSEAQKEMSASSANHPIPQNDERLYSAMANVVRSAVTNLLQPFMAVSSARELLQTTSAEAFFEKFLVSADTFTAECCQGFAQLIRELSNVAEVRATPTIVLAKQVRQVVFENPDAVLTAYVQALAQANVEILHTANQLRDTSVLDAGLKGVALGQLAGGFGQSGKSLGMFVGLLKAGEAALAELNLQLQQVNLILEARQLAYRKVLDYLTAVSVLPEAILDYGAAKCLGGTVNFQQQREALASISTHCAAQWAKAIEVAAGLAAAEWKQTVPEVMFKVSGFGPHVTLLNERLLIKRGWDELHNSWGIVTRGKAWGVVNRDADIAVRDIEEAEYKVGWIIRKLILKVKNSDWPKPDVISGDAPEDEKNISLLVECLKTYGIAVRKT
jgi:hypothetical protein